MATKKNNIHIAIVASNFNRDIVDRLYSGAISTLEKNGINEEKVKVVRQNNLFLVNSSKAERIVRKAKTEDKIILAQVMNELKRLGVVRALERAGIGSGTTVRIGSWEMEWE